MYQAARPSLPVPLPRSTEEIGDRALLRKGQFWRYEEEYRLVRYPDTDFSDVGLVFEGQKVSRVQVYVPEDSRALLYRRRGDVDVTNCLRQQNHLPVGLTAEIASDSLDDRRTDRLLKTRSRALRAETPRDLHDQVVVISDAETAAQWRSSHHYVPSESKRYQPRADIEFPRCLGLIPPTQGFRRQLAKALLIRAGKFAKMPESPFDSCGGDRGRPGGGGRSGGGYGGGGGGGGQRRW